MSKKNYFEPEMEVVDIKLSGVLCASDPGGITDDNQTDSDDNPGGQEDFD